MQGCLCGYFLSMLKKSIRRHHTSSIARDTMKIGQRNPSLLSEQHRTHLLILFITLTTGAFTDEDVIRAPLGGSATFKFKVTRDMTVSLAEWSRCPNHRVFVFSPSHGLTIVNNSYAGRLFAKSNHSVVLDKLQESDFVTYCYKLSTFPQGSLQGQINLVKRTENGLPNTVIISVGCGMGFLVLCGIIAGLVCYKKRRSNPALNPGGLPSGQSNKPKNTRTQSEEEMQNEDHNYLKIT